MFGKVDPGLGDMIKKATENMVSQKEAFNAMQKMLNMKLADLDASNSTNEAAQNFDLFGDKA